MSGILPVFFLSFHRLSLCFWLIFSIIFWRCLSRESSRRESLIFRTGPVKINCTTLLLTVLDERRKHALRLSCRLFLKVSVFLDEHRAAILFSGKNQTTTYLIARGYIYPRCSIQTASPFRHNRRAISFHTQQNKQPIISFFSELKTRMLGHICTI